MRLSHQSLELLPARLLHLSRDEQGVFSKHKVKEVLTALKKALPPHQLKPILKGYLHTTQQALRREQAVVEHAGTLEKTSVAKLKKALEQRYNRSIQVITHHCPELIAGIRIRIADDVYESSPAADLRRLLSNYNPISPS